MDHAVSAEVMGFPVATIENDIVPLSTLIDSTTEEPILDSYFIVSMDENNEPYLSRFSAWTDNYILVLVHTAHGAYLLKHDRNP